MNNDTSGCASDAEHNCIEYTDTLQRYYTRCIMRKRLLSINAIVREENETVTIR